MELLKDTDVLLIPVGGYYTIDAGQAAKLVHDLMPRYVIPMHFRDDSIGTGFGEIGPVECFTEKMDRVMMLQKSEMDPTEELSAQVVVLQPKNALKPRIQV